MNETQRKIFEIVSRSILDKYTPGVPAPDAEHAALLGMIPDLMQMALCQRRAADLFTAGKTPRLAAFLHELADAMEATILRHLSPDPGGPGGN